MIVHYSLVVLPGCIVLIGILTFDIFVILSGISTIVYRYVLITINDPLMNLNEKFREKSREYCKNKEIQFFCAFPQAFPPKSSLKVPPQIFQMLKIYKQKVSIIIHLN